MLAPFILEPFQQDLVDHSVGSVRSGKVPAVVLATGGGKTVLIAETAQLALARGRQVVVIAHRIEIIQQIAGAIARHNPGVTIELVIAGSKPTWQAPVTVGMVPSMVLRTGHLGKLSGCVLLADECHHMAPEGSWATVIAALDPAATIGYTATPVRPNNDGLGDGCGIDELLIGPQVAGLIEMGRLSPYHLHYSKENVSSSGLHRRGGRFDTREVEEAVKAIDGQFVPEWKEKNPDGLATIFVGASVEHCYHVAELFRAAGIRAEGIDGNVSPTRRHDVFGRFRANDLQVLCSCSMVDEGLDVPHASCLQLGRHIASLRLYRQLWGRVLRVAPGKDHAIGIDHTDTWSRLPKPDADIEWHLNKPPRPVPQGLGGGGGGKKEKQMLDRPDAELDGVMLSGENGELLAPAKKRMKLSQMSDKQLYTVAQKLGKGPAWVRAQQLANELMGTRS